ncbi:DUF6292 family protein [Actinophytocola sp.]|uniref:DUF6292 family protein n=1 Tax=Actinophytocola sp. TaxID=1872138 RepID=UPI00389A7E65
MMELDFDDSVARGLLHYVRRVSRALDLHGECSYVQTDEPFSAYIALDGRLGQFPNRDVALLWEEGRGWSAAVESGGGEELLVVARLGADVLPPPAAVAAWARALFEPRHDLRPVTDPDERPSTVDGLGQRLAAYVTPVLTPTPAIGLPAVERAGHRPYEWVYSEVPTRSRWRRT